MQSFLQALQAGSADHLDLAGLRHELELLILECPEDLPAAARALDSARRQGALPQSAYRLLVAMLVDNSVARLAIQPAVPMSSAQATKLHASPPSVAGTSLRVQPAGTRLRPETGPQALDTDHRIADPHTWTSAGDDPLYLGRILGRHYQLERKLGEGGMGVVYLAKDLVEADFSEQPFLAIKVLKPNFRDHPDALKALHEEVRKSRTLSHPNIVSVYTFDRDASIVFMTMEYLEGKPLNELIEKDFARGMPLATAWPIIEGAGRALAYAHDRGVVHSDFKPSNVFVSAGGRPKVLDFGIARAMRRNADGKFDAGSLGALTEVYASCEMLAAQPADLRDDVYAYACVIYEMLSGRHVFGGRTACEARDAKLPVAPVAILSKAQNTALARALSHERTLRTGSIEEVIEGLTYRPPSRPWGTIIGLVVLAAALIGAGVWWRFGATRGPDPDQLYVTSLLEPNADVSDAVDPERIGLLMDQGNDYLEQARRNFDPAVLSEGVSTAYGAYRGVLKLDPANRPAAEKILEIVKVYESQARTLQDQGQFKRAALLVSYALKMAPNRDSLKQLQEQLSQRTGGEGDGAS